jgi:hypothetical protein
LVRSSTFRVVELVASTIDRPLWWRLLASAGFRDVKPMYDAACELRASDWTDRTQASVCRLVQRFENQWAKETAPISALKSTRELRRLVGATLDQWQRSWAQVIFTIRLVDRHFDCDAALALVEKAREEEQGDDASGGFLSVVTCDRFMVAGRERSATPRVGGNRLAKARASPSADNIRLESMSAIPRSILVGLL